MHAVDSKLVGGALNKALHGKVLTALKHGRSPKRHSNKSHNHTTLQYESGVISLLGLIVHTSLRIQTVILHTEDIESSFHSNHPVMVVANSSTALALETL